MSIHYTPSVHPSLVRAIELAVGPVTDTPRPPARNRYDARELDLVRQRTDARYELVTDSTWLYAHAIAHEIDRVAREQMGSYPIDLAAGTALDVDEDRKRAIRSETYRLANRLARALEIDSYGDAMLALVTSEASLADDVAVGERALSSLRDALNCGDMPRDLLRTADREYPPGKWTPTCVKLLLSSNRWAEALAEVMSESGLNDVAATVADGWSSEDVDARLNQWLSLAKIGQSGGLPVWLVLLATAARAEVEVIEARRATYYRGQSRSTVSVVRRMFDKGTQLQRDEGRQLDMLLDRQGDVIASATDGLPASVLLALREGGGLAKVEGHALYDLCLDIAYGSMINKGDYSQTFEGGLSGLAEALGFKGNKAAGNLRQALDAFTHFTYELQETMPGGKRLEIHGLLTYALADENVGRGRGRSSLRIDVGAPFKPSFRQWTVAQLGGKLRDEGRLAGQIVFLPRLVDLPVYGSRAQWTQQRNAAISCCILMRDRAREYAKHGDVTITHQEFETMAAAAGFSRSTLGKHAQQLREVWCKGGSVSIGNGRGRGMSPFLIPGQRHNSVRFADEHLHTGLTKAGQREAHGQRGGLASVAKREGKRRPRPR